MLVISKRYTTASTTLGVSSVPSDVASVPFTTLRAMTRTTWLVPFLLSFIAGTVAQLPPTLVVRQAIPSPPPLPPPFPLPNLTFHNQDLQNAVVCSPLHISWLYTGSEDPGGLSLYISSSTLSFMNLTDTRAKVHSRAATPAIELSSSLDPAREAFDWPAVTVPEGWYLLTAFIPDASYSVQSGRFLVSDNGNTSCAVTSPSSSTTSGSPSITPSQSSAPGTSHRLNVAAITGGVVGGVILLLLSLFVCIFFNGRSRRSHPFARYRFNKEKSGRGWGGLASVDSHAAMGRRSTTQGSKYPSATTRRLSYTGSHATFVGIAPVDAKYGSSSQEDVPTSRPRPESAAHQGWLGGSPSEEKFAGSEEMELEGLPTLGYPNNKSNIPRRSHSTSTFASELTMGQQYRSSDPQTPMTDTVMDPPTLSPTSPASPPSSVHQQRKTPRKPVPAYTPSLDGHRADPFPELPLSSPSLNVAAHLTSPSSPVLTPSPTTGHYTTHTNRRSMPPEGKTGLRTKSKSRLFGAGSSQESVVEGGDSDMGNTGLVHKSSFGPAGVEGKPLHFLVPDILPLNGGK